MSQPTRALRASIGRKAVMAVTGLLLFLFVVAHMLGNLQIYAGQDAVNSYAAMLKSKPGLLWTLRGGLLVVLVLHVGAALSLVRENRAARPIAYAKSATVQASVASRTMLLSGVLVLLFVVYHLLHFTVGVTHPEHFALRDALGRHDVFSMTVRGFQQPVVTLSYVLAMLLLTFHLSHGVSSWFQSLGIEHPRYNPLIRKLGPVLAIVILVGNCSMPLCCLFGFIQEVRP